MAKRRNRPPHANRTPRNNPRGHMLSIDAADQLAALKGELDEWPSWFHSTSTSVVLELLIWRFKNPDKRIESFSPSTRHGRPTKGLGEHLTNDRPVPPSTIRKLAGVDPVTKQRKLY